MSYEFVHNKSRLEYSTFLGLFLHVGVVTQHVRGELYIFSIISTCQGRDSTSFRLSQHLEEGALHLK